MVLAGGMLAGAGCGIGGVSIPCGNANPDPCVCDRPSSSSAAAEACSEKRTCEKAGEVWQPGTGEWGAGGKCAKDAGALHPDGSGNDASDGSRD